MGEDTTDEDGQRLLAIPGRRQRVVGEGHVADGGRATVDLPGGMLDLPDWPGGLPGGEVTVGIRPEDLEDAAVWTGSDMPTITVRADVTEDLGSEVNVLFAIDAPPVETDEKLVAADTVDLATAEKFAALGVHRLILMPSPRLDGAGLERYVDEVGTRMVGKV